MADGINSSDTDNDDLDSLEAKDIAEISSKLLDLKSSFDSMLTEVSPYVEHRLRELAGKHFDEMVLSHEKTLANVHSADPELREAAIEIGKCQKRIGDAFSKACEELIVSDPIQKVRSSAAAALGNCYAGTKDGRIGRLLASIVLDEKTPEQIRLNSFMALIRVNGIMDYSGPSPIVVFSINEVDWSLVRNYYIDDDVC